jgi:DNA polymerase V
MTAPSFKHSADILSIGTVLRERGASTEGVSSSTQWNYQDMSIPMSTTMLKSILLKSNITRLWPCATYSYLQIPKYSCVVPAGFPSPADDHLDGKIDFNEHLVEDESATFVARASGNSMIGEGIHDGDELVVQFGLEPKHGDIVVAIINGEHFCKKLRKQGNRVFLDSANSDYQPMELREGDELTICGVVKFSIHRF